MALAAGDKVGRFEIIDRIGIGGMGEVYRARDPELDRDVAIKLLPTEFSEDVERLSRLEREARTIGRLQHPNLLSIFDFGRDGGSPYLVCELFEGRTLDQVLASGPPSRDDTTDVAVQIARGLAAAHDKGVIHRDLKPSNIFVTREGLVKILDFGLAKLAQHPDEEDSDLPTGTALSAHGAVLGTARYMAPEQAAGRPLDHRADQFALGVILYEMIAGRRPFTGDTPQEIIAAILRDDPEPLVDVAPAVPAALRWVIERCLDRDPTRRYASTHDLVLDLEASASRAGELASPQARDSTGGQSARTGRGALAVALALMSVAAVFFAAGWFTGRDGPDTTLVDFQQITFRRGTVTGARFDPSGEAVLYSAAWEGGSSRVYLQRPQAPDPIVFGPPDSRLVSASPEGELLLISNLVAEGPFQTVGELNRMTVTGGPRSLADDVTEAAFGPDGQVAAMVQAVDGRSVLQFPVGVERLSTPGFLLLLRLSPDGERVAVAHSPQPGHDWGRIEIFDRDGTRIQLDQQAGRGLAWSPSGDEVWFVSKEQYNRLDAVDLDGTVRSVATFPSEIFLFDIAADGRVLLATEQRRYEIAGRRAGVVERDLTWLEWSVPFDLSADGQTILFNECVGQGSSCRIALRGFGDDPPVVLERDGFGVALSPDGRWVVSAPPWDPRRLVVIATGSGDRREFELQGLEKISVATWAPDATAVYFAANAPGEGDRIYRLDLDADGPVPITPEGIAFGFLAVSPDGGRIAAKLVGGGIAVFPVGGGDPVRIDIDEYPIRWSTDGRHLYTVPIGGAPATLRRVTVADGSSEIVELLAPDDPAGVTLVAPVSVTPDGETYVYGFVRRVSELFVVTGLGGRDSTGR